MRSWPCYGKTADSHVASINDAIGCSIVCHPLARSSPYADNHFFLLCEKKVVSLHSDIAREISEESAFKLCSSAIEPGQFTRKKMKRRL